MPMERQLSPLCECGHRYGYHDGPGDSRCYHEKCVCPQFRQVANEADWEHVPHTSSTSIGAWRRKEKA